MCCSLFTNCPDVVAGCEVGLRRMTFHRRISPHCLRMSLGPFILTTDKHKCTRLHFSDAVIPAMCIRLSLLTSRSRNTGSRLKRFGQIRLLLCSSPAFIQQRRHSFCNKLLFPFPAFFLPYSASFLARVDMHRMNFVRRGFGAIGQRPLVFCGYFPGKSMNLCESPFACVLL